MPAAAKSKSKTKGKVGGNRRTDFGPASARNDTSWWLTKHGGLAIPADLYCRLRASGQSQWQAYSTAYGQRHGKVTRETLRKCGTALESRPQVRARIQELRAQANDLAILTMAERRALLAQTARAEPADAPTHGNRIAAIREDAILAGERQTDAPVNVSIDLANLLSALSGASSGLRHADAVSIDMPPKEDTAEAPGQEDADAPRALSEPLPLTLDAPTLDNPTGKALMDLGD